MEMRFYSAFLYDKSIIALKIRCLFEPDEFNSYFHYVLLWIKLVLNRFAVYAVYPTLCRS